MTAQATRVRIPDAFAPLATPARYKVYYGGRGAAKSWSFGRMLLLQGCQRPLRILCTREIQNSIEDSVHRLLIDAIAELGLDDFYADTKKEIVAPNGTLFRFEGLRYNTKKIKSFEGIDIAWIEEAEAVSQRSLDLLIPTVRKDASELWFSFNPDLDDDPVYKMFVLNTRPDSIVRKVLWYDNPWFPDVLRREMEYDRAHDVEKYEHVWNGNLRVANDAQIFRGKYEIRDFDVPSDVTWIMGGDWGFADDPAVVLRAFVDDDTLYVDDESYGVGIELDELPAMYDTVLPHKRWPVIADSARPDVISFMNRRGYNVQKAKKGPGSIEAGIERLRNFRKIVVRPRCKHTKDELKLYSYKVDAKTSEVLPIIIDKHNHCIDSLRYATEKLARRRWGHVA